MHSKTFKKKHLSLFFRLHVLFGLAVGLGFFVPEQSCAQPISTLLKNAERETKAGHFLAAAEWFERAGRLKNADPELLHKAAESYDRVRDYIRAADGYRVALNDARFPLAPLRYARALKQQGRYEEAAQAFETFAQNYRGDFKAVMIAVAENEISGCDLAGQLAENQDTTIELLPLPDSLNSAENEFAPIPFSEQLLYFSLASVEQAELMRSKRKDTLWGLAEAAKGLPESVSTQFRSGCFAPDGSRFYYSACSEGCSAQRGGSIGTADCALYSIRRTEEGWSEPERLPAYLNLEGSSNSFPHISQAEGLEYLFFSSNRAGGLGGLDLYVSERPLDSETLDFSFPKNLGRLVNTGADEVTPFYETDTKALWFSSLGHPSLGGMDVFKTENETGNWSRPQNAGLPINSPADDYFFTFKRSGYGGFLSSNRRFLPRKMETTNDDLYELRWH